MANVLPKGKWAKDWDACRNCGTTLIPHKAEGLCNRCYLFAYKQNVRSGHATTRTKRGKIRRSAGKGQVSKRKTRRGGQR